jgi:hypothetical protein
MISKEEYDNIMKRFGPMPPPEAKMTEERPPFHPYNSQKEMEDDMIEIPKVLKSWDQKIIEQLAIKNQLEESSWMQDEARKNFRKTMSISVIAMFISIIALLIQILK